MADDADPAGTPEDLPLEDELEELPKPPPAERSWPRPWMRAFFATLALVPDATGACQQAGISRQTAYRWRNREDGIGEHFREAWDDCVQTATDRLERAAYEYATVGAEITEVREKLDADGNVVERTTMKKRVRSVGMTIFMLKAWKPERYRGIDLTPADADAAEYADLAAIDKRIAEVAAELDRSG